MTFESHHPYRTGHFPFRSSNSLQLTGRALASPRPQQKTLSKPSKTLDAGPGDAQRPEPSWHVRNLVALILKGVVSGGLEAEVLRMGLAAGEVGQGNATGIRDPPPRALLRTVSPGPGSVWGTVLARSEGMTADCSPGSRGRQQCKPG